MMSKCSVVLDKRCGSAVSRDDYSKLSPVLPKLFGMLKVFKTRIQDA